MSEANETYISLETAKLLKDCGVESKMYFNSKGKTTKVKNVYKTITYVSEYDSVEDEKRLIRINLPAFSWQEILWEHAEEFFPEYKDGQDNNFAYSRSARFTILPRILELLQEKKYEEADLYFREKCILIK